MKKLLSSTLAVALVLSLAIGLTSLSGNKVEAKAKKHKKLTKIEKELKTAKGEPLQQTIDIVTKYNYKAKYYNQGEDATDYIDAIADDMITVKTKVNKKKKTVRVDVLDKETYASKHAKDILKKKLPEEKAWGIVQEAMKEKYGKKFRVRFLTAKISADNEGDSVWFLKAKCKKGKTKYIGEFKVQADGIGGGTLIEDNVYEED